MGLDVTIIPCRADNYAYLLRCDETGETAVVDVPDAKPILAELHSQGLDLNQILITHHHDDHISGVEEVKSVTNATVLGATADQHRLPVLDTAVTQGDTFSVGKNICSVIEVYGHTIGHIAFHFAKDQKIFSADSLMALGCGRVFEGTKPQMWETMQKFIELDPDTLVYPGHEYTQSNAKFALTIEPENQALQSRAKQIDQTRAKGGFTVPSTIKLELETNPFMRANTSALKNAINMGTSSDADVFTEIRTRKDNF